MKKSSSETSKLDRKTVEKNRRVHMKDLCFKLASLVPHHFFKPSKDMLSQQDQLELAACYIKQMRERVEKLKRVRISRVGVETSRVWERLQELIS
ncbi:hypothetical protein NC651_033871 [Populus alba x Populus x berolinensis]|nr:hypothetical protein NC651_033871 [Populus alba x Populus x berolinensis]